MEYALGGSPSSSFTPTADIPCGVDNTLCFMFLVSILSHLCDFPGDKEVMVVSQLLKIT
ncbi:hypothetical protein M404DRAFT_36870 [Pisolithus tinctorius Marx 270]|uniref:Uncharacterized protein n=1 Tax=Pisolithus tinctorius Marx 270 TaxID=870435 RepID=A0A0C3N9J9_PISTI|nr:hypothetical protein M404DRAFT_36870 [Pisolithus tinctorius Marx 270]